MRSMRSILLSLALQLSLGSGQQLLPRDLPSPIAVNATSYTNCANTAWPPSNAGTELIPQAPDAELQAALKEINIDNIRRTILKLVSFGTRNTLSTQTDPNRGIGAARDWIAAEMRKNAAPSNGRMVITVPSYIQPIASRIPFPVRVSNVLATLKGETDPGRIYIVSGHYDSRASDVLNYVIDAPGANDDASGVAVSIELARIMATRKTKSTIIFTAVAGEEQGLLGANFFAQTMRNSSQNVEAMFTNDIIGSSTGDKGQKDKNTIRLFCQGPPLTESTSVAQTRLTIGGENDSPARQLGRFVAEVAANDATGMNVALVYRLDRFLRGGDHSPFLQQGYAAARFTEPNEDFAHQHQDVRVENGIQYGDLPQFVDYEYVSRVAKVNLATLWSLAGAPPKPRNVTIDTTILGNDSLLKWLPVVDADLAGYEIVWRATDAPLWTHVYPVGNVNTATIPISKDNVILAVRAVGKNGYKSPAVYPFPG